MPGALVCICLVWFAGIPAMSSSSLSSAYACEELSPPPPPYPPNAPELPPLAPPLTPAPASPPSAGAIITEFAGVFIFGAVGVYTIIVVAIGQTTGIRELPWLSGKLGTFCLGAQVIMLVAILCSLPPAL